MQHRAITAGLVTIAASGLNNAAWTQVTPSDVVHGNLIQFTDNGAWSWFQDERAVVDGSRGRIFIGSVANQGGVGGSGVDGHVRVAQFDLNTGRRRITALNDLESYGAGDDHNLPGMLVKEDGNVLAFYAAHNNLNGAEDDRSYHKTFDTATESWGAESQYRWWNVIPGNAPGSGGTTYSNVFQLAAEDADGDSHGRLYNIARTKQSPHIMYSDDNGGTWHYGGQLTKQASNPPSSSYVNGYYKYSSNGVDRIDIIATEFHPRDYNTSLYHAYIKVGKLHDSAGNVVDGDVFDLATSFDVTKISSVDNFTKVFQAGPTENSRAWQSDVQIYPDGSISVLFKARDGAYNSDHRVGADSHNVWFARYDPVAKAWSKHEIAKAGGRLFTGGAESDYTGLGALDPDDPSTIYISTEVNPLTNARTAHHEIYKGVTADGGAMWAWTAVTENSSYDNLRPIIPKWDTQNTAVIWWRGSMSSSQNYDTAVTGLVLRKGEQSDSVHYVDAGLSNTMRADGEAFQPTSGAAKGGADGNWHVRTGLGNGSTVLTAGETTGEDAPVLKTTVADLNAGTYDVFAFFWSDLDEDWRLLAGLSQDDLILYRRRGAQQAEGPQFDATLVLDEADRSLYRAYLGRVSLTDGEALNVFIDNHSTSDTGRVWYDGIGYAPVRAVPEPTAVAPLLIGATLLHARFAQRSLRTASDTAEPQRSSSSTNIGGR